MQTAMTIMNQAMLATFLPLHSTASQLPSQVHVQVS